MEDEDEGSLEHTENTKMDTLDTQEEDEINNEPDEDESYMTNDSSVEINIKDGDSGLTQDEEVSNEQDNESPGENEFLDDEEETEDNENESEIISPEEDENDAYDSK